MSLSKTTLRFALAIIGSLPLLNNVAQADDATTNTITAAALIPFATTIRADEKIGFETVRRVSITVGTNEFAFALPRGTDLRVDASASDKIVISSVDSSYFVTLRLISLTGQSASDANELFKNMVLAQYDGAENLEQSSVAADGQFGPAFDANWYVGNSNTRRLVRVGFIPTQVGTLECSLVTDPKKSVEARSTLGSMLMTLRSNRNGKLENVIFSDKS